MKKETKNNISEEIIRYVARLSRISISDEEVKLYNKQLARVLDYINKLNEVAVSDTLPTSHPQEGLKNVFRKDTVRPSLPAEDALLNAPKKSGNFFNVPKVVE